MRRLCFGVLVAVVAVACGQSLSPEAQHDDTLIAILRGSGTLVPFGKYVNGGWQSPVSAPAGAAPATLGDLGSRPAAWFASNRTAFTTWFGQLRDGPRVTVRARLLASVGSHCDKNWGLSSDFPPPPSESERPLPVGVAMTAEYRWDPFVDASGALDESPNGKPFNEIFDIAEENELIRRRAEGTAPDLPFSAARARTAISIDVVRRSTQRVRGVSWSYVEATRTYAAFTDRQCPLISSFKSWIAATPRDVRLIEPSMALTDCDRKGTISSMPLGMVTIDGTSFVVTVDRGYEDESYSIIQLAPRFQRELTVVGGGC